MLKKELIIVLVFIQLIGCHAEEQKKNKYIFVKTDSISIKIPDSLNYQLLDNQILNTDTGIVFVGKQTKSNTLVIYNFKSKKLSTVDLKTEGKNSVKAVSFFYHNPDSIFIFPQYPLAYYLINSKSEIMSKALNIDENYRNGVMFDDGRPIYNSRTRQLFFYIYPENYNLKYDLPTTLTLNLSDTSEKKIYGSYPSIYKNLNNEKEQYAQKDIPNTIIIDTISIVSFEVLDSLQIYNTLTGKLIQSVYAGSKYVKNIKPWQVSDDYSAYSSYLRTEAGYINVLKNKKRNWIYRIVKHTQDEINSEGLRNNSNNSDWSVITLDNTYTILFEQKFKGNNKNWFGLSYAVDDELYVYQNTELKEGYVCFDIYSIMEK